MDNPEGLQSFNEYKISKLINLQKLFIFQTLVSYLRRVLLKISTYFTQPAASVKFIYLFIYFYQSIINYKVEV